MYFDRNDFFDSLRDDRFDESNPTIPEGLVDLSRIIDLLIHVMSDGRMIKSDSEYAFGDFVLSRFAKVLLGASSDQDLTDAIVALFLVLFLVLKQGATHDGLRAPEETLKDALDETTLRTLRMEFSTTPTVFTPEGRLRPNFLALSPFQTVTPISPAMLTGFMKRNLTPHLPFLFVDSDDSSAIDDRGVNDETETSEGDFQIVEGPLEGLIADPLNGFDEFQWHFWLTDHDDYGDGLPVDGIDPDDDPDD